MAIPNIVNVIMIAALFFLIFGIIGVNFFKGLYYYCDFTNIKSLGVFKSADLNTKFDCLNYGGEWMPYDYSFDNIFASIEVVFNMS